MGGCCGGIIIGSPGKHSPYQDGGRKIEPGKEKIKPSPKPEDDKDEVTARPAHLVVSLPADARLKIEGEATTSTSAERSFVTPALPAGKNFKYTLQAEVTGKDGKPVNWSQKVTVRAGQTTRVTLAPPTSVASR